MSGMPLSVYILIPIHNRKSITLQCLELLSNYHLLEPPYQAVIIDDGSTDDSKIAIEQAYPTVKILSGDGSLWWTGAMHMGMQYAYEQGAQFICWLNNDCAPSSQAIPNLVQYCQQNTDGIAGCQGYQLESERLAFGGKHQTWQGFRMITVPIGEIRACDLLSGNLVCLPRAVIDRVGYPDTCLTPHYGGDSLYLIRARKAGFSLFVDARSLVYDTQPTAASLYPQQWLLADGEATRLLKLAFVPQSGLSWRLWWAFNWEAYGLWGVVMFCKKYLSLLVITLGRFLPRRTRETLHMIFTLNST
jgi:glycosyltransferase involved in cell wall biosynthesis